MFGHTWVSQYGALPEGTAADTWATALVGMSPQQLATGMRATVKLGSAFPPSAPHFRLLCCEITALIVVRAELQARETTAPSPFARLVWQWLDTHRWRTANADQSDRLLREAYNHARDLVMQGHPLPDEPVAAIEQANEPERGHAKPEDVQDHMAKCREAL